MPKETVSKVPANPVMIEWPADTYGATSDLKTALLKAASGMNGQQDKYEVIMGVLEIGIAHVRARFKAQIEDNKQSEAWRAAQEAERLRDSFKGYQA